MGGRFRQQESSYQVSVAVLKQLREAAAFDMCHSEVQ